MELNAFLEQQREAGEEDSAGVFTVAVDKAAWKLSEFLLTEKEFYPLYLLACAVGGGATSFKLVRHSKSRRDTFVFDGEPISSEELQQLSLPLGGPDATRRVRDLGTVLNVASSLGEAIFRSYHGSTAVELKVGAGKQAEMAQQELAEAKDSQVLSLFYSGEPISLKHLRTYGCYAPLELTIDGENARKVIDFNMEEGKLFGHYVNEGLGTLLIRDPKYSKRPVTALREQNRESRTLVLGLCVPAFADNHQWKLVANGVLVEEVPLRESDPPFLCGLVDASHLKTDVSGRAFVRDEAYAELWEQIDEAQEKLLRHFCKNPVKLHEKYLSLFQAELYRRYDASEMPQLVSTFLLRTMRMDPKNAESLRRLGASAKSAEDWETVSGFLNDFRHRASLNYAKSSVEEVRRWLRCETWILQGGGRATQEQDRLFWFLAHLHQGKLGAQPEVGEFRGFLLDLARLDSSDVHERLPALPVEEGWKKPLALLLAALESRYPGDSVGPWERGFLIWSQCEKGSFAELRAELKALEGDAETYFESQVWRLVILRLYRGKMSFLESRRWEITHHFTQHLRSNTSLRIAQRLLGKNPEQWGVDHRFSDQTGLERIWLPLVMSRLIFLCRVRRESEALGFLGLVLLQASLLKDGLLHCGELPAWDTAFPVQRLKPE